MAQVDAQPYEFEFEPASCALVIIDMQRDFVDPGGFGEALGNDVSLLRKAIAPTKKVLDAVRKRKMLVIHTREAADDTLGMLADEAAGLTVVLHCFSLPERLEEVVERGYVLSFAGPVTFPRSVGLHRAAHDVPGHLLMVETDSPYLAPVPRRGRPNRPANVAHTLRFIAGLRGASEEELDDLTSANAARTFGW